MDALRSFHDKEVWRTIWEFSQGRTAYNHCQKGFSLDGKVVTTTKKMLVIITITFFPKNVIG